MTDRDIKITSGKPLNQVIRIVDAKDIWATLPEFEVRAQMRVGKSSSDALISNLHEFMTWVFDANDLKITWAMNGDETRELYALDWGFFKKGYFNLVVSDTGEDDGRALVVPTVTVTGVDTTTKASGDE